VLATHPTWVMVKTWSRYWSRSQRRIACKGRGSIVSESTRSEAPAAKPKGVRGWTFAAFRDWREREHPRVSYQIAVRAWRPEGYVQAAGETEATKRALKNWEPRATGLAYSDRAVYLVEVVAKPTAESVGRVLYLADLFHRDPDYAEQHGKRLHRVVLTRQASETLTEFARRHGIRVTVLCTETAAGVTDTPSPDDEPQEKPASIADAPR